MAVGRNKSGEGLARGTIGYIQGSQTIQTRSLFWDPVPRMLPICCSIPPTSHLHLSFHTYRPSGLEIL